MVVTVSRSYNPAGMDYTSALEFLSDVSVELPGRSFFESIMDDSPYGTYLEPLREYMSWQETVRNGAYADPCAAIEEGKKIVEKMKDFSEGIRDSAGSNPYDFRSVVLSFAEGKSRSKGSGFDGVWRRYARMGKGYRLYGHFEQGYLPSRVYRIAERIFRELSRKKEVKFTDIRDEIGESDYMTRFAVSALQDLGIVRRKFGAGKNGRGRALYIQLDSSTPVVQKYVIHRIGEWYRQISSQFLADLARQIDRYKK